MQPPLPAPPADSARAEIDTLYTPLDEALAQLRERRADEKLRAKVADFRHIYSPDFFPPEPRAVLFRHIVTPNRELALFMAMARTTGLLPLCLEYAADIFSARNPDKYRLCRPVFELRPNHFRTLSALNFGQMDGQRLCDLSLGNGMPLVAFHHTLLRRVAPEISGGLHDFSSWFSTTCRDDHYYLHYLALFIRDGILFENFLADDAEELRFARERVLPSFARVVELFGVRPLIVPLLPRDKESYNDCERWRSYDGTLFAEALKLVRHR